MNSLASQIKKVMHLVINLGPGGRTHMIRYLTTLADPKRFCSSIYCLDDFEASEEILESFRVPYKRFLKKRSGLSLSLIGELSKEMKKQKINILHAHDAVSQFHGFLAAKMAGNIKTIFTFHKSDESGNKTMKDFLRNRFIHYLSDKIVAVSKEREEFYRRANYLRLSNKIMTLYNGVSCFDFKATQSSRDIKRQQLRVDDSTIVIGHVASLKPIKGQIVLLSAFKIILQKFHNVRLVVLGQGALELDLKRYCMENQIVDKVVFLGHQTDISGWMSAFDIFVLPSLSEAFCLVILEAMAAGLPIIASRVGGIPEAVVDNETGILISPGNSQELAEAIIVLLINSEKGKKMGQNGLSRVKEHFDISRMIREYETLYDG